MRFLRYSVASRQYVMKCVSILYILFFIEFLFLNMACVYLMWHFRSLLTDINVILTNPYSLDSLTNVLSKYEVFRDAVHGGKNGGFKTLMDYTLARLYVENDRPCDWGCKHVNNLTSAADTGSHWINTLRLDVSSSIETTFVMKRMQKHRFVLNYLLFKKNLQFHLSVIILSSTGVAQSYIGTYLSVLYAPLQSICTVRLYVCMFV